jgi:hypothetical protein
MKEFLFRKNLWMLDFTTSIFFALLLDYYFILTSWSIQKSANSRLIYVAIAYVITFVLAIFLSKRFTWVPSWAWMGIMGALIRILLYVPMSLHKTIPYHIRFSTSFLKGAWEVISYTFILTTFQWITWGIFVLIGIFTVRFIVYLFRSIYISYDKNKIGFPKK